MSAASEYSKDGFINASVQTSLTDIWEEETNVYQPSYEETTNRYSNNRREFSNRNGTYNARSRGRYDGGHRGRGRFCEESRGEEDKGRFRKNFQNEEGRGGRFREQNDRGNNRFGGSRTGSNSQSWGQTSSDFNDRSSSYNKIKVVIPSLYVGRIIGKRGVKIKELQEECGAKLNICQNENNGPETEIEVCGSSEAQIKARELIEDFINHLDNPRHEGSRSNTSANSWNSEFSRRDNPSSYSLQSGSSDSSYRREKDTSYNFDSSYRRGKDSSSHNFDSSYRREKDTSSHNFDSSQSFKDSTYSHSENLNSENNSSDSSYCKIDWAALLNHSDEEARKKWASLPPVHKMFYYEDPVVANMHPHEVNAFRIQNNNIVVDHLAADDDRPIPNPVFTFEQAFQNYPLIMREINKQGFEKPSPIQTQAWPILLKGHDMIGIAQTGTGKTLAFLLPALIHIDSQEVPRSERPGPTCLVMAPTRELAQQIERETKKYDYKGIKCVCLYGGGSRRDQINVVTKGVEIVVATPGRLNDLVMNKIMDVTSVSYLVLDEADRMLDMGFEPQIKKILLDIRPERQTVMTSATWPEGVREMAEKYMNKPMQVFVGTLDLAAVHSVTQRIIMIEENNKRDQVYDFISAMGPNDKVIIFVDKKIIADDLASDFALNGIDCQSLHGNREQSDREQALKDLETGDVRILVATDVASRGLDIKDVTHIFNYGFPRNIEEYVHRVGRTGRAGQTGESITLVTREDWKHAQPLINILEEAEQEVPAELYQMAERYNSWKQRKEAEEAAFGVRKKGFGRRRF